MELKQANSKKLFIWAITVASFIVVILSIILNIFTPNLSPWQISEYSPEFSPIATYEINTQLRRVAGNEEVFMILQDNGLVFYEDRSSVLFKNYSLNRINLLTGESQWDRYLKQYVSNITNNEQAVFVAYDLHKTPRYGGNKTLRRPGAILVAAFDIDTGDTLWSLAYEGFGWISRMDANENEIGISGHNGSGLFPGSIKIDVDTGKVLAGEFEGLDETRKIRCQSGDLPLHHHLKDLADCKVVVADDNAVYVLDLLTNSPVWQVDIARAVSNFAVSNDVIYFLAQDGILWALDEKTGTILGHVQFEPVYPDKMELLDNVDFPKYTVVADGKAVALHFKETQQLFFFHFSRG